MTVQIAALRRVFAEEPGGYCEAAHAARRAVQSIPSLSLSRSLLAAAFAKLGRIEEAKAVGCKCWALDRSFSANHCVPPRSPGRTGPTPR